MSEQETIADIIAWLRKPREGENAYLTLWRDEIADRLEAAHRREVATTKESLAVGNSGDCAKLREAVGYILKYADSVACRDHDEHTRHYIDQIRKWAQSALAAPPRNCENYATVDEAMYDFGDEALIEEWNALKAGKDRDMLAVELFVFTKWLFVTATEQEGGKDENK